MRKFLDSSFTIAPALCLTLAFALGAAIRLERLGWGVLLAAEVLWLALWRWCGARRQAVALAISCLAGALRVMVAEVPKMDNYRQFLLSDRTSAELQLAICESPLLEGALAELDAGRGQVAAEILSLQTIADESPRRASGLVVLTAVDWELRQRLRALSPGEVIRAQGILVPERQVTLYRNSLRSRGIFHQFEVLEWESAPLSCHELRWGLRLRLASRRLRVRLAQRLIRGMQSPEAARVALALGLGMSEFLSRESRQKQVVSGTIHVFAISGMHIGMATLLLALLARWSGLPLRGQWCALAVCTGIYVLLTGSSISSLRALWMVWLALYASGRFRRAAWLNTLGCAAGVSLLVSPWQLLDLGFQYSHLTVLVLLLSAPVVQGHMRLLAERDAWLPRELRARRRTRALQWVVGGLEASLIAWLGNLGLAMRLNPQLSWGAPLLNLPLGVLIAVDLAACPLRLLLGTLLPHFDRLWAAGLEQLMLLTAAVAESGHQSAFVYAHPLWPTWMVMLYYAMFFTALGGLCVALQREGQGRKGQ